MGKQSKISSVAVRFQACVNGLTVVTLLSFSELQKARFTGEEDEFSLEGVELQLSLKIHTEMASKPGI